MTRTPPPRSTRRSDGHGLARLASQLAAPARLLRSLARLEIERDASAGSGALREAYELARAALDHQEPGGLTEDGFADALAQTITCVQLAARWIPGRRAEGARFDADFIERCAKAAPVLAPLFSAAAALQPLQGPIDEIERALDAPDVAPLFGPRSIEADPNTHFYEPFLAAYDGALRRRRGVFFTPKPAVSYIVRSVDEILRAAYGLEGGLASTETWGSLRERRPDIEAPPGVTPGDPVVSILDPAAGAGAFLLECVDVIERTVKDSLCRELGAESWDEPAVLDAWRAYVPRHLLPRLRGYELLLAPSAVARLFFAVKLAQTGYALAASDPHPIALADALAAPFERRFSVVIGNPPYAGLSANRARRAWALPDAYKKVDGAPLAERKLWLQDDYVKFIRLAEAALPAGAGVLGYITNHGYLNNPTFRGMRRSLMSTFRTIHALDLHGNSKKREASPDGSDDENIFAIRQGVAICIAARGGAGPPGVYHAERWGGRREKLDFLAENTAATTPFSRASPDAPHYLFDRPAPRAAAGGDDELRREYERGLPLSEIFTVRGAGFITARDHFVVDLDRRALLARIADFADSDRSDADVRRAYFAGRGSSRYADGDTRGWKLADARRSVRADGAWRSRAATCLYRPFDERPIYWAPWMIDWPRPEIMRHLGRPGSLALAAPRSIEIDRFEHAFCSRLFLGHHSVSAKEVNYVFPLFLRADGEGDVERGAAEPRLNLSPAFLQALARSLGAEPRGARGLPDGATAEAIFGYIYAVLHSPRWRRRYFEYIRRDFARIPLPSARVFAGLSAIGSRIAAHHLMEARYEDGDMPARIGRGPMVVEAASFSGGTVWLDKAKTKGFRGVSDDVWAFRVGGYAIGQRFLRDRAGRRLSEGEIMRYRRALTAARETLKEMAAIDELIDLHGGLPIGFS